MPGLGIILALLVVVVGKDCCQCQVSQGSQSPRIPGAPFRALLARPSCRANPRRDQRKQRALLAASCPSTRLPDYQQTVCCRAPGLPALPGHPQLHSTRPTVLRWKLEKLPRGRPGDKRKSFIPPTTSFTHVSTIPEGSSSLLLALLSSSFTILLTLLLCSPTPPAITTSAIGLALPFVCR